MTEEHGSESMGLLGWVLFILVVIVVAVSLYIRLKTSGFLGFYL